MVRHGQPVSTFSFKGWPINFLHVQLVPLFMAVQQVTVVWGGRRITYVTSFGYGATWAASFHLQLQELTNEFFACPTCSPFYGIQQETVAWGGRRITYVTSFGYGATWAASFHLQLQGLTNEFFACPACSPFYGSTTRNSCLGREINCLCDCFRCGATWVDRVLYFCVAEQWYGWQRLGVFMSTQLLMHTKFPCTLHFFSCSTTWTASFWLQRQGLAKCVLYLCVSDQRYGCQCLGVLMSTCSSVQSFLALSSQLRPFPPLFHASPYF